MTAVGEKYPSCRLYTASIFSIHLTVWPQLRPSDIKQNGSPGERSHDSTISVKNAHFIERITELEDNKPQDPYKRFN